MNQKCRTVLLENAPFEYYFFVFLFFVKMFYLFFFLQKMRSIEVQQKPFLEIICTFFLKIVFLLCKIFLFFFNQELLSKNPPNFFFFGLKINSSQNAQVTCKDFFSVKVEQSFQVAAVKISCKFCRC